MSSIFGRAIINVKTNKSGGSLAKGDVVIVDAANDNAVTTTTSAGTTVTVGVVVEENGIASNATGRVQFGGHVSLVTPNASVTRGHYGTTHTVAKQCTDAGASRVVGAFCVFTTAGTTPEADLFVQPDASSATGNVATDAIWDAAGDLALGTGANTAAKLASGAAGTVLTGAGVGVAPTWAAGGITTDTYGTDSDGGTSDTATGRRMAAKKITITTAGRLVSIGGYILGNATQAGSLSAMLLDNNGGVPGKVIAMGDAVEGGSILLSTTVRAIDIPVSAVVTATDYWIAIFWYNNTGSTLLRYVASGSDYTQAATGTWALDNGVGTGYANSSRTYSIRASVIR